jgi:hypothetical protein
LAWLGVPYTEYYYLSTWATVRSTVSYVVGSHEGRKRANEFVQEGCGGSSISFRVRQRIPRWFVGLSPTSPMDTRSFRPGGLLPGHTAIFPHFCQGLLGALSKDCWSAGQMSPGWLMPIISSWCVRTRLEKMDLTRNAPS